MYTSPHNWKSQSPGPWSRSPAKTSRALRSGMFRAIQMVLRIKEGGLIHGGPPCSSYVWLNRGTSKRSTACPEGDSSEPSVRISNMNLICVFCGWTWYWWKKTNMFTFTHIIIMCYPSVVIMICHMYLMWIHEAASEDNCTNDDPAHHRRMPVCVLCSWTAPQFDYATFDSGARVSTSLAKSSGHPMAISELVQYSDRMSIIQFHKMLLKWILMRMVKPFYTNFVH